MKKTTQFFDPTWRKLTLVLVLSLATFVGLSQTVFKQAIPGTSKESRAGAVLDVTAFGARGDGSTNDAAAFQNAINRAVAGDTVYIPPATYRINTTLTLKSGIIFSGYDATLYIPPASSGYVLLQAGGTSNLQIKGVRLKSDTNVANLQVSNIQAIQADTTTGTTGLVIRDVKTEGMYYGFKLKYNSNFTVENYSAVNDGQVYLAYNKGGVMKNISLNSFTCSQCNNHNLYMERRNEDILIDGLTILNGSGYSIHLYHEGAYPTDNSKRVTLKNVRMENPTNQGIVVAGYDDVTLENVYGSIKSGDGFIKLYTSSNLKVSNFDVAGTSNMFIVASDPRGSISTVNLANGKHHQPTLISGGSAVSGLTTTNVSYDPAPFVMPPVTSTTTTLPSSTTTTSFTSTTTSTTTTSTSTTTTTTTTTRPVTTTLSSTTTIPTTTTLPLTTTTTVPVTTTTLPQNFLSVSFLAPPDGSRVSGKTNFKVYVNTNLNISKVDLYIDGILRSTDRKYPYYFSVNTSNWTSGTHTIKAIAYTTNGLTASKTITVVK